MCGFGSNVAVAPLTAREMGRVKFVFSCVSQGLSRLCRDAGGSDARHLGLWSVGRGEEDRLLGENML